MAIPVRRRPLDPGIRLTIRGRTVRLRALRRPPSGLLWLLSILGPGLVAANAGNDAGGIATYASAGAKYGYDLLWVILIITLSLAVVQEMAARLGAATGRGLLDLVRERFGIGWALFAVAVVLLANMSVTVTEFLGIRAALELFGISPWVSVPLAAAGLWWLVVRGSYRPVEKVFVAMTLVFLAYPAAAVLAHPDWGEVARRTVLPTVHGDSDFLLLLVATVGTTVSAYQPLFQQSAVVERRSLGRYYGPERWDVYVGAAFSQLVAWFIIVATAATLHLAGATDINTAGEAAEALAPVAGQYARVLFAVGILGASLLAGAVLPLATAYSVSEAFGFRKGVNLDFRRAPIFVGLFTVLLVFGALVALFPGLPVWALLIAIQVLNGLLLPVVLVFLILLLNDRRLVGDLANGHVSNLLAWLTAIVLAVLSALLLGSSALQAAGLNLFGASG
ncbi:MAG TPA: Nramp family divalent metal transporter [Chloroflexota bacterium]|nr:Nramp family divalent metal transporter [Chloroflexota bacterium]